MTIIIRKGLYDLGIYVNLVKFEWVSGVSLAVKTYDRKLLKV